MPRKTKTAIVNELPVNLAEQASDNAGTVPAAETVPAIKKYSAAELGTLLSIATSLLGQQPYGTHPDAVLSRAKAAFDNAEAILPLYQTLADKDA